MNQDFILLEMVLLGSALLVAARLFNPRFFLAYQTSLLTAGFFSLCVLLWFACSRVFLVCPTFASSFSSKPLRLDSAFNLGGALLEWQRGVVLAAVYPCLLFFFLSMGRSRAVLTSAGIAVGLLSAAGFSFLFSSSLIVFLVSFELILPLSLFLLKLTSKSERVDEALVEMAFWTLLGSLCLLMGFISVFTRGIFFFDQVSPGVVSPLFVFFLCCGFGVKVPLWPCAS